MAAHAGEKAQEDGIFHCQKCNEKVRVNKGATTPKCRTAVALPMMSVLKKQAAAKQIVP
ncbi:MAG TPA: hypothetical protein VF089_18140 [Candidatus Binatia bacterium]